MESESQLPPPREDRPATIDDEGEHHPHRSVLTKVKDKAVKIKDTIKKHSHGHEHEGGGVHQEGYAEEEDEDEDNEAEHMVEDPELHGAPIYDSTDVRSENLPAMETDITAGDPKHAPVWPPHVEEAPMVKIGHGGGLEADPNTPDDSAGKIPPEIADLTGDGGKEGNIVAPLVSQFDNMSVRNESDKKPEPEEVPAKTPIPENPVSNPKPEHTPGQNTIAGKISSATSAAAGAAVSAKNAVASKLGYGGGGPEQSAVKSEGQESSGGGSVNEYMSEKLKPGEEDRALSEKITEALRWKKEGAVVEGSRVKESEEVAARLGPAPEKKREGEDALAAGAESSGQGVVDRLKDAVGAWLGKGAALQTAQDSVEGTYLSDPVSATDQVKKGEEASGEKKEKA